MTIPPTLRQLLNLPTASFVEDAVLDAVERKCGALSGVRCRRDDAGNLVAHYRHGSARRAPLAFSAHTDHPGFVAGEMIDRRTLLAEFRGGVYAEYLPRAGVRFWSDGRWVRGRVSEVTRAKSIWRMGGAVKYPEQARIRVERPVMVNSPGMWDFPDAEEKRGCVYARGCDDVAGVAGLVELLIRLSRKRAATNVICLFTRAEEVGFVGAIAAARGGTLPKSCPIIAIETSSARGGGAEIGGGPVLRVGDRASIFTPELTDFCQRVGDSLARKRKAFRYQRKLMAGGTCETTAYMAYGYQASGICLALGNYHNMDIDRRKLAPEYVSIADWNQMVDWFEALAVSNEPRRVSAAGLRREMDLRLAPWKAALAAVRSRGARR